MNYILVGCVRKLALIAWLFCLSHISTVYAAVEVEMDSHPLCPRESTKTNSFYKNGLNFRSANRIVADSDNSNVESVNVGEVSAKRDQASSSCVQNFVHLGDTDLELTYDNSSTCHSGSMRDSSMTKKNDSHANTPAITSGAPIQKRIVRILFVEDAPSIQKLFALFMNNLIKESEYEYEYKVCSWGYEALGYYTEMTRNGMSLDLILTDINMEHFYLERCKYLCRKRVRLTEKAGIEFAKAIRGQKRRNTFCESLIKGTDEEHTSLYACQKIDGVGGEYRCVDRKSKSYSTSPYTGPIVALTSAPNDIHGCDKHLFYTPETLVEDQNSAVISGVRDKLGSVKCDGRNIPPKDDLRTILIHHSLFKHKVKDAA